MNSNIKSFLLIICYLLTSNLPAQGRADTCSQIDTAISLFHNHKTDESAEMLSEIISRGEISGFSECDLSGHVYLARIYLRKGKITKVKQHLDISDNIMSGLKSVHDTLIITNRFIKAAYENSVGNYNNVKTILHNLPLEFNLSMKDSLTYTQLLGLNYWYRMSFDSARYYFHMNIKIAAESGDIKQLAEAFENLGLLAGKKGELDTARYYFLKSRDIYRQLEKPDKLCYNFNFLGVVNMLSGHFPDARRYFEKSLELKKQLFTPDHISIADTYSNLGAVYSKMGEYHRSVIYDEKALAIRKKTYGPDHVDVARSLNNIGVVLMGMDSIKTALPFLYQALAIKEKYYGHIHMNTARTYLNIGKCHRELDNLDSAAIYFATTESIASHFPEEKIVRNELVENKIELLRAEGNFHKALSLSEKLYRKKLEMYGESGSEVSESINSIAGIHHALENYDSAIYYYNLVHSGALSEGIEYTDFKSLIYSLAGNGRSCLSIYYEKKNPEWLKKAVMNFSLANNYYSRYFPTLNVADQLANSFFPAWFDSTSIEAAYEYYLIKNIQETSQLLIQVFNRNNARLSNELIRKHVVYSENRNPVLQTELELLTKISAIRLKLRSVGRSDSLKNELFVALRSLEEIKSEIYRNNSQYFQVKYGSDSISLSSIQSILTTREVILQYYLTSEAVYLMMIAKDDFRVFREKTDDLFEHALTEVVQTLNTPRYGDGDSEDYELIANKVYQYLLFPVEKYIREKELIIFPDERLYQLPFEALVKEVSAEKKHFSELDYLLYHHSVSYSNSLPVLVNRRQGKESETSGSMLMAKTFLTDEDSDLLPIKGTAEEVRLIGEVVQEPMIFTDSLATEDKLWKHSSGKEIVHIATHSVIDKSDPFFSGLYLSKSAKNDGIVYGFELIDKNLTSDLVTLSACHSGSSSLMPGEGMLSLANGFIISGVKNTLMSLWETNDETSVDLLTGFYKYLSEGNLTSRALRQAKIDYIRTAPEIFSHPHYWSVFVLNGDNTYKHEADHHWKLYLLIAGGLLLFLIFMKMSGILFHSRGTS